MIIDAKGLTGGDRLKACSDEARLWWPYLFLQANGFGRMELDYHRLIVQCAFKRPPTEEEFCAMVQEYRSNYLAFVYEAPDGAVWLQWWAKPGSLPRYQTAEDKRSPEPPAKEYERWKKSYVKKRNKVRSVFTNLARTSRQVDEKFLHGVGVGVGIGEGVGVGGGDGDITENPEKPPESPALPPPPIPEPRINGPHVNPEVADMLDGTVDRIRKSLIRFAQGSPPGEPDTKACLRLLKFAKGDPLRIEWWLSEKHRARNGNRQEIRSWGWFLQAGEAELPAVAVPPEVMALAREQSA